ncbi:hypothetical protein [Antrihabitans sp. YC2-6]|uniref:hypothetical protein n=1 Tax=Antrihabitans sp. YC2-6 TaxID=2799498 RepID=UPI0018F79CE4|nr:hypothetical protein [Antrihabitans sp. YC2-6]MBJ8345673.1 hypothetical protein [Antrihabitans sp. YC2-6]
MITSKFVCAAAIVAAAVVGTAGTAHTEPLNIELAPTVHYTTYKDGAAAVISIDQGSLVVDGGRFQIRSANGDVLAGVPLEYNVDEIAFPIDATIDGHTARLTPSVDPARAYYKPVAMPFQDQAPWRTAYEREQAAWARMTQTITTGAAAGAIAGAIGTGLIGCLVGGTTAGIATGPLAMLFGAGPLAGCLIGAAALAPLGVVGGAMFVGAPVAIAAFIQYQDTINAPFAPAAPR